MEDAKTNPACADAIVDRFEDAGFREVEESLAVEEPLEIRIVYGAPGDRRTKSISVTMRTPGNDAELAAGFLFTEGVIRDVDDIDRIFTSSFDSIGVDSSPDANGGREQLVIPGKEAQNVVTLELASRVRVSENNLQ